MSSKSVYHSFVRDSHTEL